MTRPFGVFETTLREKVSHTGVGLHTGKPVVCEIVPAQEGSGIVFCRTDLADACDVAAHVDNVIDTRLATTLGGKTHSGKGFSIGTVEHLLAAFMGLGIDNARVLLDGPEVPILDGSAMPWVEVLLAGRLDVQRRPRRYLAIKKTVEVNDGDKWAKIMPADELTLTCALDFDHPLISPAPFRTTLTPKTFVHELAKARTFGFLRDVKTLQAQGLALGGSLDNAIVIDAFRVLNPEGLRYCDEFVRHKALDAIGDLSLCGHPILGHIHVHRGGHALNTQLLRAVLEDARAFAWVEAKKSDEGAHHDARKTWPLLAGI